MKPELTNILSMIHLAEKLKSELRHSWLSDGRQESVAEHTWRVSLMAVFIQPYLKETIQMEKLLKMIIIHDLAEAEAGDLPAFDTMNNDEVKQLKMRNEQQAMEKIRDTLGDQLGQELYEIWVEYEEKASYEARVANALDKLEVQIQHNEADISTWLDIEHRMSYMMDKHVTFDPLLSEFKDLIEREAEEKMLIAGIDVESIKQEMGK